MEQRLIEEVARKEVSEVQTEPTARFVDCSYLFNQSVSFMNTWRQDIHSINTIIDNFLQILSYLIVMKIKAKNFTSDTV